ncbi:hypothetical protein AWB70_01725 [Caballeronia cordobensis]|uniref:Uncharacterized protein n=1 Tax=Caballeronia cordobensis TaxID=1353886 RepID=A0A158G9W3_CABCO|nr:hypothetical protein [Caballeronia cordobensis]SAL28683.1 hypothetical protein AWB70_01725 [Caballeronia cordobensis]
MIYSNKTEAYWEPLMEIARDELGIESFDEAGAEIRICCVEDIGRALERAYDLGLVVGHAVTRGEWAETSRV